MNIFKALARVASLFQNSAKRIRNRRLSCRPRIEVLEDRTTPAVFDWKPGANSDQLWSNLNNWRDQGNLPGIPGVFDTAHFSAANITDAKIDFDYLGNLGTLQIDSGYTGTITMQRALYVDTYTQNGGTVTGAYNIYVANGGAWNGGTLGGNASPTDSILEINTKCAVQHRRVKDVGTRRARRSELGHDRH